MVFFIVVLWHATMAWYFIVGGLILWAVDHAIKVTNAVGTQVQLVNISSIGNAEAVQLEYTAKQLSMYNIIYNTITGERKNDANRYGHYNALTRPLTSPRSLVVNHMKWANITLSISQPSPR